MLVAWRERVQANGDAIDDTPNEADRRLLNLVPLR